MSSAIERDIRNHTQISTSLKVAATGRREPEPTYRVRPVMCALAVAWVIATVFVAWGPGGTRPIFSLLWLVLALGNYIAREPRSLEPYFQHETWCGRH